MEKAIKLYKEWKRSNPDKDYQYDEITNFVDSFLSRGQIVALLEFAESNLTSPNKQSTPCLHHHHYHDMGSIICIDCNAVLPL